MMRPPPSSTRTATLFPYSTLFRSLRYANKSLVDYTVVGLPAGTLTDRISSNKVFTQEASLNSTGSGDWRWSVGVFYRHDKDGLDSGYQGYPPALASLFGPRLNYHDTSKSRPEERRVGKECVRT